MPLKQHQIEHRMVQNKHLKDWSMLFKVRKSPWDTCYWRHLRQKSQFWRIGHIGCVHLHPCPEFQVHHPRLLPSSCAAQQLLLVFEDPTPRCYAQVLKIAPKQHWSLQWHALAPVSIIHSLQICLCYACQEWARTYPTILKIPFVRQWRSCKPKLTRVITFGTCCRMNEIISTTSELIEIWRSYKGVCVIRHTFFLHNGWFSSLFLKFLRVSSSLKDKTGRHLEIRNGQSSLIQLDFLGSPGPGDLDFARGASLCRSARLVNTQNGQVWQYTTSLHSTDFCHCLAIIGDLIQNSGAWKDDGDMIWCRTCSKAHTYIDALQSVGWLQCDCVIYWARKVSLTTSVFWVLCADVGVQFLWHRDDLASE